MGRVILYIDGENFRFKVEEVLQSLDTKNIDIAKLDFDRLFDSALSSFNISEKLYYLARLREHQKTLKKSKELISKQRALKTALEKQRFHVVLAGNVRARDVAIAGKRIKTIFNEKGVDVKIAVDLVIAACDKTVSTAIICSSDSDLQPAIKEAKNRGVEIVYLGFEASPNKGLTYTTSRTILFRNSEILAAYQNDLTTELKEAKSRLVQVVDSFPREKRESILFDEWSLKNLLSHLSGWAQYQIDALEQLKKGSKMTIPKNLKASINEGFVIQREKWGWNKVYREFLKLSEVLIKEYEDLPEELWKNKLFNGRETTVEDFIKIEISHYNKTHGSQIKRVLKGLNIT